MMRKNAEKVDARNGARAGRVDAPLAEVVANGISFKYLDRGAGPLVLFLHGFPDNAWTYSEQLDVFAAAGYRAVAPFMRGYAPSSAPSDGRYDPRALGEDLIALIAALSPNAPAAVVGMDWGGVASHAALAMGAENIAAAVVMNAAHPYTILESLKDPVIVHRLFHFWFFQLETAEWSVPIEGLPMIDYIWGYWSPQLNDAAHISSVKATLADPGGLMNALGYYRSFWSAMRNNTVPVGPISTPTLSIFGGSDVTAKYSLLEKQAFVGPYRRVVLPSVGHFPHRELVEPVNELLLGWIRSHLKPSFSEQSRLPLQPSSCVCRGS
jgi:pimeloyl-ACP methyl ester carboxylesterase